MSDLLVIRVQPSKQNDRHLGPLTAWMEGCKVEGYGCTVFGAIEDLFSSEQTGACCAPLEQKIAEMEKT